MTKPKSRLRPVPVTSVERQLAREIIELSNGTQLASIDLGRDGSKWRHGWIPLNPVAAAIKAKKKWKGHGGNEPKPGMPRHAFKTRPNVKSEPSGPGRTKAAPPRERAKAMLESRKLPAGYTTHKPAAGFTTTIMDEKGRTAGTITKRDDRKYHAQHGESDKVTEHPTYTEAQGAVLHQHSLRTAADRGEISMRRHDYLAAQQTAGHDAIAAADQRTGNRRPSKRATKEELDHLFGTKQKEADAAAKAARRQAQIDKLPGQRPHPFEEGKLVIVKKPGENPFAPSDAYAVEHQNGATMGHIRVKEDGLYIGNSHGRHAADDWPLPEHKVKNVKEAIAGLSAAHALESRKAEEKKVAEAARVKKIVDDGKARALSLQAQRDADNRAKAIISTKHAVARDEANRKRFAEIPKGIKPTVTKNDTAAKEKARGIIEARLKSEPIDVHAHNIDVNNIDAGQAVKFKVSKYEETAQPPHTKVTHNNYNSKTFEHPDFGTFTTDANGVVQRNRTGTAFIADRGGDIINDADGGNRKAFARVGNDIVYRHHDVTGKPKYVGEEERVGHVVHAGFGTIHVSDGKHTYTAMAGSKGRLSGNFDQRDPVADKKMVADYLSQKVTMRSSSGDFGKDPTIRSTHELYARGEAAFRARMAAKKVTAKK